MSQMETIVQYYRPLAFFAACTYNMDGVVEAAEAINEGVIKLADEQFRPTSLKENSALYVEDMRDFGKWMLRTQEERKAITITTINKFLKKLVHRRWARFHVNCADSPVEESLRMSFHYL